MKVIKWLDKYFEEFVMSVFLCGVVIMMSTHVFCRYVLKSPLTWTEEATRYMFIWFVFMGVSYGLKNGTHIRVNIIETFFPQVIPVFSWIQDIVSALFIAYMTPAAIASTRLVAQRGQVSPGLHLPMQFVYLAMLLALGLSIIRLIQKFVIRIKSIKK